MIIKCFFVFVFSISLAYALTKETAVEQCSAHIDCLKKAPLSSLDGETQTFFKRMIVHLETILLNLKKTEDIKEIYLSRQSCDKGFKAAQWIVDHFSGAQPAAQNQEKKNDKDKPNAEKITPPSTLKKDTPRDESPSKKAKVTPPAKPA